MGRNIVLVLLVVLVLLAGGFGYYEYQQAQQYKFQADQAMKTEKTMVEKQQQTESMQMQAQQKMKQAMANQMTVTLAEENKSGESGTATLKEENGKVTVTLALTGFVAGVSQPAHIHIGDCPGVGKVVYPLTNVVDGQSTTMVNTTLADLKKQLPLAINVHKSAAQVSVYTACGSLGTSTSAASGSVTPSASVSSSVSPSIAPATSVSTSPAPTAKY